MVKVRRNTLSEEWCIELLEEFMIHVNSANIYSFTPSGPLCFNIADIKEIAKNFISKIYIDE